jgi:hypothetical protein
MNATSFSECRVLHESALRASAILSTESKKSASNLLLVSNREMSKNHSKPEVLLPIEGFVPSAEKHHTPSKASIRSAPWLRQMRRG